MTMKNSTKFVTATATGAVGILALAACSSGANEAPQESRDAAAKSTSSASSSGLKSGRLAGVSVHRADGVTCTEYGNMNEQKSTYQCNNLKPENGDRAVVVNLPMKVYEVEVKSLTSGEDPLTSMVLDGSGNQVGKSKTANRVTWNSNGLPTSESNWGVAVGVGGKSTNSVIITVTHV